MEMGDWHCFKCKEKMEDDDAVVSYLDFSMSVVLPKCPKCGEAFVTPEFAEQARDTEEMLEDKPGEEDEPE